MDRGQIITVVIVVAIIVAIVFGMGIISNMTGNAITGSVADDEVKIEEDYFKINEVKEVNDNETINDTQNKSR